MRSCALLLVFASCVCAITRDQFYPYGQELDQRLPRGKEVPAPELPLRVPIVFYGESYDTVFVNNYGVLSFRANIPSFLNSEFPLPYPSIAAFYTNVDTSQSGTIYYRETDEPHVLTKAEGNIQNNFHEYYDFKPRSVLIATWVDVTYSEGSNRKNTFQIAVISNGTESFVEFLYPDREIQWIQADVQPGQLPDAKAQAGFVAEDGRVFTLRGSGSHQIRNIVSWTNVHEPGKYVYRVGNIPSEGNAVDPDQYNQTEVEVEEESKTCAQSGPSVCHIQARCVDYQAGICCQCLEGQYGNGKSCVKDDIPLRVHGKLNGVINDQSLNDVDLQAYVVVADGRSYTALSNGPVTLGPSLQLLSVLGGVVGWLFAKPSGNAKNGYQLTGSQFNHTADIFFPATGDRVTVNQEYIGHNVFDQITLEADVRGSVPVIFSGTKLEISEYEEQYTVVEPGLIRSESIRTFTNKATGERYEQRVSQTFTYTPCPFAPLTEEDSIPSTLRVVKNYLGYEARENIVRYGMSNKIAPLGQEDPCIKGKSTCGPHSTCVVKGDSFACVCQTGFTSLYLENAPTCVDVDECTAGTHNCDSNADCYNHEGGFQCRCHTGFEGNGVSCTRVSACRDKSCDVNAQCVENYGAEPTCVCNFGYTGDGQTCYPNTYRHPCENCSPYARCVFDRASNTQGCACNEGYSGDGYYCSETQVTNTTASSVPVSRRYPNYPPSRYTPSTYSPYRPTDTPTYTPAYTPAPETPVFSTPPPPITNDPDYNETYVLPKCDTYGCTCPPGYSSFRDESNNDLCRTDNYEPPTPSHLTNLNDSSIQCDTDSDCPPNAICHYSSSNPFGTGHCICPEGYEGDAYECIERTGPYCSCGFNAHCIETVAGDMMCVCDAGYHGDGYVCRPNFSCTNNTDCEYHAECRPDATNGEYVCQCIEGYIKDQNDACIPDGQLCNDAVCAEHASCLYDDTLGVSYCHCDQGYEGDGISQCIPRGTSCDITNDCHPNAACTPNDQGSYQCVCNEGFTGDGYSCQPEATCRNNPYMCDTHASCLKRNGAFVCECNTGYNGNGSYCLLNPRQSGNFLIASDGASVYRVPFRVSPREFATPINSAVYQIAVGLDVDCETGRIYWGDVVGNSIKRAAYDGSGFENFLANDVKSPEGLSIDWSARNLFWTDSKKLTIEVANLDTRVRKVLFSTSGISNPRGIVVHPQRGKIFWSDWNRSAPKIEWANMDGSQRGVFLDQADVKLPNSLAIDWQEDRLCYADAGLSVIKCVGIDSLDRQTVVDSCSYPFGLAIHGQRFYWSDWKTLKIEYIDTATLQKGQMPIATASRRLYGVTVAPDQCPAASNVCQFRNGNCEADHLCLPDGRGGRACVAGERNFDNY